MTGDSTKVTVVKIGGATFDDHGDDADVVADIVALQARGERLVVVHGGGKLVTEWLDRQGIETRFVRGERVTDRPALEVATAVLAGLVNKEIVAAINCLGGRAVGISGVDGALAQSRLRKDDVDIGGEVVDMGFVGEVVSVDATVLTALLDAGFVPVVSPISLNAIDRGDDFLVDEAGKDGDGDFEGRPVGDPFAANEPRFDTLAVEPFGDQRAAAVDDYQPLSTCL